MQINLAPLRLASCARRQKWMLLVIELLPQMTINLDSEKNSVFIPNLPPKVYTRPSPPAEAQMVRSKKDAPSL